MTVDEIAKLKNVVRGYFPNMDFEENVIRVWYDNFLSDSYESVADAVKRYGQENKFPPSIADIKERIKPVKVVPVGRCTNPECINGKVIKEVSTTYTREVYGTDDKFEYAFTCPVCHGWKYNEVV